MKTSKITFNYWATITVFLVFINYRFLYKIEEAVVKFFSHGWFQG